MLPALEPGLFFFSVFRFGFGCDAFAVEACESVFGGCCAAAFFLFDPPNMGMIVWDGGWYVRTDFIKVVVNKMNVENERFL